MIMDYVKELSDRINKLSGRFSGYQIFCDWVELTAISIRNCSCIFHNSEWRRWEQRYVDIFRKYTTQEFNCITQMTGTLVEALEEEPSDVLGAVFMQSGIASNITGQFFTPFHLSLLTARVTVENLIRDWDGSVIPIAEPSCGSGGMIIAAARILRDNFNIDYQKYMRVVAQDLDWKAVFMCYVQLSLLGIDATCVQGDTLKEPYDPASTPSGRVLRTPRRMGVLL